MDIEFKKHIIFNLKLLLKKTAGIRMVEAEAGIEPAYTALQAAA